MNRLCMTPEQRRFAAARFKHDERLSTASVAVLVEIQNRLADYEAQGRGGTIALRWQSLAAGEIDRLREVLGKGEISATVSALGDLVIQDTAIPCVWWVSYRDGETALSHHWIEVSEVPFLLRGDRASISMGLQTLRERAAMFSGTGYPLVSESSPQ